MPTLLPKREAGFLIFGHFGKSITHRVLYVYQAPKAGESPAVWPYVWMVPRYNPNTSNYH